MSRAQACGIVTGNFRNKSSGVPGGHAVIHVANGGILEASWANGKAYCYRARLTRAEAEYIQGSAQEIKTVATYGAARAIFKSWSGSSKFASGALERLKKYHTRMSNHQGVPKNMYCSELVVVAYELALHINQQHAAWIDLDGKHTLPSTLKGWMTARRGMDLRRRVNDANLDLVPA